MSSGYDNLTGKEKEVLRLILQGHDAKSMAAALDLSVHTINERLRNARRKLSVTSSKEAARLVLRAESKTPENLGPKRIGGESSGKRNQTEPRSKFGFGSRMNRPRLIGGVVTMSLVLATLIVALQPADLSEPTPLSESVAQGKSAVVSAARRWLELSDAGDWAATYDATSASFRELNTLQQWTDTASSVRPPLGVVLSRELVSVEFLPTPENYRSVRFRTDFAKREGVVETMTLVREDNAWHVVGIFME